MNKRIFRSDLIEDSYNVCGEKIEREEVARIIDGVLAKIKSEIADGNTIELRGFGVFRVKKRNGRANGRNPRTGETVSIPPRYAVTFKPGADLKEKLGALGGKES